MPDITVLSDSKSTAFEQFFGSDGFSCQQVVPGLFGTPYYRPSKMLIIPSAFAIPMYYKILPALEGSGGRIEEYVENGGIVLAYGAGLDGYRYRWLPMEPTYHRLFNERDSFRQSSVLLVDTASPGSLLFEPGLRNCDSYYSDFSGDIAMALDDGRPVVIHKSLGKGHVIISGIFDYPDRKFVEWACSR